VEIALDAVHIVRAPLARIIALVKLITVDGNESSDNQQIVEYLLLSANELDKVITKITSKSKT